MRGFYYESVYADLRECKVYDGIPLEFLDGMSPEALEKLDTHVFADDCEEDE